MAKVLLTTLQPPTATWHLGRYELFRLSIALSGEGKHQITCDPDAADIILFCDEGPTPYLRSIRQSPLYRRYWQKCFVFDSEDAPIAFLPGVYASIEKNWHNRNWTRSGFYVHIAERSRFDFIPFEENAQWLYSFAGTCYHHPVREALKKIDDPRFHLVDTSGRTVFLYREDDQAEVTTYKQTVRNSKFVLCPRGVGTSSIRLFETMRMGRVPVILSDDWVPPEGPLWEKFSVRVAEADVSKLPGLLASLEPQAAEMAALARAQWEQWFSESVLFETAVDWCLEIHAGGRCGSRLAWGGKYLQYLRPGHFRNYFRIKLKAFLAARSAEKMNKRKVKKQ